MYYMCTKYSWWQTYENNTRRVLNELMIQAINLSIMLNRTSSRACCKLQLLSYQRRHHHKLSPKCRYKEFPDVLRQDSDHLRVALQSKLSRQLYKLKQLSVTSCRAQRLTHRQRRLFVRSSQVSDM